MLNSDGHGDFELESSRARLLLSVDVFLRLASGPLATSGPAICGSAIADYLFANRAGPTSAKLPDI